MPRKIACASLSGHCSRMYRRLREKGWDIIVYFSGHGLTDPEDKSNYLLPVDANPDNVSATAYRLDALYRNLRRLTDGKITVILEACFSGRTPKGQIGGKTRSEEHTSELQSQSNLV